MNTLFSIIIPTYNRAHLIEGSIRSVLNQQYQNFELLVVDDGSTDNTSEVVTGLIQSNPEIKISYFKKVNEERSIARNYGAKKASGEYLVFLDSDDRMSSDHLSALHDFLQQNKFSPEFIFSGYKLLDETGKSFYQYGKKGPFNERKLTYGNYLGCSAVTIKTDLFKKHHFNTNPKLIYFEDWELWLRVIHTTTLYCIPTMSIIMDNHGSRSVLNFETRDMVAKIECFRSIATQEPNIIHSGFIYKQLFLMGLYSYAALHIALLKKDRIVAIRYLFLSFINCPLLILNKRFYSILKHLI